MATTAELATNGAGGHGEEREKAVEGRRLTAEAAGCSMEPEDDGAERIDDEVSGCGRQCRRRGRRSTRGLQRGEQGEGSKAREAGSATRPPGSVPLRRGGSLGECALAGAGRARPREPRR